MIRLYLVRHGIAFERTEWKQGPDEHRPLNPEGRRRFRKAAKAFARLGDAPDHVFTSPLVRAVQTAELLAAALKHDSVELLPELKPDIDPEATLQALAKRVKDGQGVALVGHDPHLSKLLARLAELPRDAAARLDFKKGAIVRVDVPDLPGAKPAQTKWWLRPKKRDVVHGLPLRKPAPRAVKKG